MGPESASDLGRVGQLVGSKFRLDAVIGRGGMGTVWAATHVNLGHRVAIKLVAREFVRSPEVLRRFDAEAKAAARLQSRHVVQVFDSGVLDDGTPYIAMELLAGENLDQRVQRSGPMSSDEAIRTLAQCCKALARAHAAGIVHRDIKPENVFLARAPDEDADVAKILDFGVAKITMELDGRTSATGTGALLGTPIYMSPEQVRGGKDIDHRTDLYSLGLVAFTIMTGKLAIDSETFGEVVLKICTHPLPSLCSLAPHLPAAMDGWFQRACAREAVDRHQSAQEFIDTLRAAAGERAPLEAPVRPGPPTPSTLLSAGGGGGESAGPFLGQTGASVSVTAAVGSAPAGVPRVRPAAVLAGVLSAAMLIATGAIWFAFSPHTGRASSGSADETNSRSPAIASASVSLAPTPPPTTIETVDAASPVHTHTWATPRSSAPPP
ncbi:MAG: serine/threonine protein kinase, partial [Myxococcota bacterium]|nr:serine/threonine protein kinase [Myxococcota bacterium]